jgi:hypothetical protein
MLSYSKEKNCAVTGLILLVLFDKFFPFLTKFVILEGIQERD